MKIKVVWISKTDYLTWWDDMTWRYKLLLTSYLMTVIKLHCFINENKSCLSLQKKLSYLVGRLDVEVQAFVRGVGGSAGPAGVPTLVPLVGQGGWPVA
jgi:hypothetical protein